MKHLYIENGVVTQIHCDDNPQFSVEQRFPAIYLASCMQVEDPVEVQVGYLYIDGVFRKPEPEDPKTPIVPGQPTQAEKIKELEGQLATAQEAIDFLLMK